MKKLLILLLLVSSTVFAASDDLSLSLTPDYVFSVELYEDSGDKGSNASELIGSHKYKDDSELDEANPDNPYTGRFYIHGTTNGAYRPVKLSWTKMRKVSGTNTEGTPIYDDTVVGPSFDVYIGQSQVNNKTEKADYSLSGETAMIISGINDDIVGMKTFEHRIVVIVDEEEYLAAPTGRYEAWFTLEIAGS